MRTVSGGGGLSAGRANLTTSPIALALLVVADLKQERTENAEQSDPIENRVVGKNGV